MGHVDSTLVFDNRPSLPGVSELKEILPGVTIGLSDTTAKQTWEVRYCLQSHLLLFSLSPVPSSN